MKKTTFKDGDKVRLKKNLKVGNIYGSYKYKLLSHMVFTGEAEISQCNKVSCTIQDTGFYYPFEMLVKVKP